MGTQRDWPAAVAVFIAKDRCEFSCYQTGNPTLHASSLGGSPVLFDVKSEPMVIVLNSESSQILQYSGEKGQDWLDQFARTIGRVVSLLVGDISCRIDVFAHWRNLSVDSEEKRQCDALMRKLPSMFDFALVGSTMPQSVNRGWGSGRAITIPFGKQYDEWCRNLNLAAFEDC